ncbi:MAG: DAK2 domain-containing protein, partial [Tepidiformaceae bacterium]
MTTPLVDRLVDGARLRAAFDTAARHLRGMSAFIDAINVYPVPDGDTGANMAGTLRDAVAGTEVLGDSPSVHQVLEALARGALYGARGNSGVILSQALRGFATGVGDRPALDAAGLAAGLTSAEESAYAAVSKPVEGTMLTVLRSAAKAATACASVLPRGGDGAPCGDLLAEVVRAADAAERETTSQLPALAEAGVPDAGGEGICVMLRGLLGAVSGIDASLLPLAPNATPGPTVRSGHRPATNERESFGFCTEFFVEPEDRPVNIARLRKLAGKRGNSSVMVVGDGNGARVHVHTAAPEGLIASAGRCGRLSRIKVEDMDAQHARFNRGEHGTEQAVDVLAMSPGAGFDAVFRGLGAAVSNLGRREKPSAGEIAAASDQLHSADVIVLPNHANVRLVAEQAAKLVRCTLHVIPTASLPQGIAAVMAFDPRRAVALNVAAMTDAAAKVRTIEIATTSVSRRADGIPVRAGQSAAFVEGKLIGAAASHREALV